VSLLTPEQLTSLAEAAVAAPWADNRRAFRLQTHGVNGLRLFATHDLQHAAPTRRILGLLSIGAVAENLAIRAGRLGLHLKPDWQIDQSGGSLLTEFVFDLAGAVDDPLDAAIERRHSNRRLLFRGPRLESAAQERMSAQASTIDGTALVWLDQPEQRRRALGLIRLAETERFRNEELHRELFDSIRFDAGWHAPTSEGLSPGSLELPRVEQLGFSALRHWGVQRVANLVGTHRLIGLRSSDLPCRLAPHLCAIVAQGDDEPAAIQAGRLLQRVWLQATLLGLAVQVYAASTVYALDKSTAIDEKLRGRLASGWKELCPQARPFIVFRMGRAAQPSAPASRPPPSTVLSG